MKRELLICALLSIAAFVCCSAHGQVLVAVPPPAPPQSCAIVYQPVVMQGQWVAVPRYTLIGNMLLGPRMMFVPSPPPAPQPAPLYQAPQQPQQPPMPPPQR